LKSRARKRCHGLTVAGRHTVFIARFATAVRTARDFSRYTSFTAETHLSDALNAMFYQPPRFMNPGRADLPDRWDDLRETMPLAPMSAAREKKVRAFVKETIGNLLINQRPN
jgi:hypothetical protein